VVSESLRFAKVVKLEKNQTIKNKQITTYHNFGHWNFYTDSGHYCSISLKDYMRISDKLYGIIWRVFALIFTDNLTICTQIALTAPLWGLFGSGVQFQGSLQITMNNSEGR